MITLVLLSAVMAAGCNRQEEAQRPKVYMRSDSTAAYSGTHHSSPFGYYLAFRSLSMLMGNGGGMGSGYYSRGIPETANVGTNAAKMGAVSRGGFGRTAGRSGFGSRGSGA